MNHTKDLLLDDVKKNLLIAFSIVFLGFYLLFIKKDVIQLFFYIVIIAIFVVFRIEYSNDQNTKNDGVDAFIKKIESDLKTHIPELDNSNIYKIHKPPSSLRFILQNHDGIKHILFNMRKVQLYDKMAFYRMIIYIEYFLKYHFNMMIGVYDYNEYIPIIKDIRIEILNISKSLVFTCPRFSPLILLQPNLQKVIDTSHRKIQEMTFKYLQTIKHKYIHQNIYAYDPPWEYERQGKSNVMF
jgi:hypothetical protein